VTTYSKFHRLANKWFYDNIHAPAYKTAKYLNNKLNSLINLPHTYTTKNAHEVAEELITIHIYEHMKIITLNINDLDANIFHVIAIFPVEASLSIFNFSFSIQPPIF
jgi:hypothetical protein